MVVTLDATRIGHISRDPDGARILVPGIVNLVYSLAASDDLRSWTVVEGPIVMPTTAEWEFFDPAGETMRQRFYRLIWHP